MILGAVTVAACGQGKKGKAMAQGNESKSPVAYFSATGTTENVAKMIASATDGELYRITPAKEYSAEDLDWWNGAPRIINTFIEAYNLKGKSVAQVALRWLFQTDVIIIPKSTHKERMAENLNILDFELAPEDIKKISSLDMKQSLFMDHHSGEATKQFMEWRSLVKPAE